MPRCRCRVVADAPNLAVHYRGPVDGTVVRVTLDAMVALYDRRAGVTHLLGTPAVTILDALREGAATAGGIAARLDLADEDVGAVLTERLDELVASGMVEAT